jgi:deazaflavin-dependent oxidoreductase (nitroreductase family)
VWKVDARVVGISNGPSGMGEHHFPPQPNVRVPPAPVSYTPCMQAPRFMRRVNRALTNRLVAPLAGFVPPLALVRHVGRKTGRLYRTPVLAFPIHGGTLTPLPYGTDTDWLLNLLAAGAGEVESAGRRAAVENPRVLDAEEAMELVPELLRPLLRLASLPGFLVLDRSERPARPPAKKRSPAQQRARTRRS